MKIQFSKQAAKYLNRLDAAAQKRIRSGIFAIPQGDIRPLRGFEESYRLRVGDWRILFSYQNDFIFIEKISPRGDAYKGG